MNDQLGAIADGEIQLSRAEEDKLLHILNRWNADGIKRLEFKLLKWRLIRAYVNGVGWADRGGRRNTAAARLLGRLNGDGNVDDEPYSNNVMMRIHMSNMQRLGRFNPDIDVMPSDASLEAKQGARRTTVFLNDLLDRSRHKEKERRRIDRILCLTGSIWLKVYVAPPQYPKVRPKLDNFGKMVDTEELDEDMEVRISSVHPKNVVFPPYCDDPENADWLIENNVRTTDYVLRTYGVSVKPQAINTDETKWWRLDDGSQTRNEQGADGEKDDNLCIVHEAWVRRCVRFPEGAHIIWCGKKILASTTLDDKYPDITYYKAEFIYDDEDIDGETPYWFMIPMQDALNRVESDIRRHQIMMTKPKWQQHTETILEDPDGITNETAQVLKWSGTVPPGIILAPDLPQTVFTWRDMVLGEMMSIGAAHDIVRPSQPRSGTAIAYEQEQDDTTLAPTIASMGVMYENALGMAARLFSQHCHDEHAFSMRGAKGRLVHQIFKGTDLNNQFNVKVNMQSGLPANKIARQQLIVQLKNQQIISAEDAKQFFEFGQESEAIRAGAAALERAEQVIESLQNGNPYPANPIETWDNLPIMKAQLQLAMQEHWNGWDEMTRSQFKMAWDHVNTMLMPPMPMMPAAPGVEGQKPPLDPGAQPPIAPPGVPDSGQNAADQPPRPADAGGGSLYDIPGME